MAARRGLAGLQQPQKNNQYKQRKPYLILYKIGLLKSNKQLKKVQLALYFTNKNYLLIASFKDDVTLSRTIVVLAVSLLALAKASLSSL